jgi:hypothetical protein
MAEENVIFDRAVLKLPLNFALSDLPSLGSEDWDLFKSEFDIDFSELLALKSYVRRSQIIVSPIIPAQEIVKL